MQLTVNKQCYWTTMYRHVNLVRFDTDHPQFTSVKAMITLTRECCLTIKMLHRYEWSISFQTAIILTRNKQKGKRNNGKGHWNKKTLISISGLPVIATFRTTETTGSGEMSIINTCVKWTRFHVPVVKGNAGGEWMQEVKETTKAKRRRSRACRLLAWTYQVRFTRLRYGDEGQARKESRVSDRAQVPKAPNQTHTEQNTKQISQSLDRYKHSQCRPLLDLSLA